MDWEQCNLAFLQGQQTQTNTLLILSCGGLGTIL